MCLHLIDDNLPVKAGHIIAYLLLLDLQRKKAIFFTKTAFFQLDGCFVNDFAIPKASDGRVASFFRVREYINKAIRA
jgi:hypothetical protein